MSPVSIWTNSITNCFFRCFAGQSDCKQISMVEQVVFLHWKNNCNEGWNILFPWKYADIMWESRTLAIVKPKSKHQSRWNQSGLGNQGWWCLQVSSIARSQNCFPCSFSGVWRNISSSLGQQNLVFLHFWEAPSWLWCLWPEKYLRRPMGCLLSIQWDISSEWDRLIPYFPRFAWWLFSLVLLCRVTDKIWRLETKECQEDSSDFPYHPPNLPAAILPTKQVWFCHKSLQE